MWMVFVFPMNPSKHVEGYSDQKAVRGKAKIQEDNIERHSV